MCGRRRYGRGEKVGVSPGGVHPLAQHVERVGQRGARLDAPECRVVTAFGLEREASAMSDDGVSLPVDELVEYCRTQAALLAGRTETIGAETDELLDEIDEDIAEIRTDMAARTSGPETPTAAPPTAGSDADEITELESRERELEEKQALAEAKQARMTAFQELSEAYAELAAELDATVDDEREALGRIVRFERDHDAPAYFDERLTTLEAVAESNE
jgi:hypothetical protein